MYKYSYCKPMAVMRYYRKVGTRVQVAQNTTGSKMENKNFAVTI